MYLGMDLDLVVRFKEQANKTLKAGQEYLKEMQALEVDFSDHLDAIDEITLEDSELQKLLDDFIQMKKDVANY